MNLGSETEEQAMAEYVFSFIIGGFVAFNGIVALIVLKKTFPKELQYLKGKNIELAAQSTEGDAA